MRESSIESYFKYRVKEAGGLTRKFVSPGRRGVPDQIAVFRYGEIHFVELKAPTKEPRPDQLREHKRLRVMGCAVWVIRSREDVDNFVSINQTIYEP